MSISRLPNEILGDIFKRTDADSANEISKVCRRFRAVTLKNNFCRPVAETLRIGLTHFDTEEGTVLPLQICIWAVAKLNGRNVDKIKNIRCEPHWSITDIENKIIEILNELNICGTRFMEFNLYTMLNIPAILYHAGVDLNYLRGIKDLSIWRSCGAFSEKWRLPFVDDRCLDRALVEDPETLRFRSCVTAFTLDKVIETIEMMMFRNKERYWNFGRINSGILSRDEFIEGSDKMAVMLSYRFNITGKSALYWIDGRNAVHITIIKFQPKQTYELCWTHHTAYKYDEDY